MFIMISYKCKFQSGSSRSLRRFFSLNVGWLMLIFTISCSDNYELDAIPKDEAYALDIPAHFPEIVYNLKENPLTKNGVELGRKLFYEGKLSRNNTISCGFCHIQEYAFTHHGHSVSHGIDDQLGVRNAPPIQNMAFLKNFTWDGVSHNLEERSLVPITTSFEMDSSISDVVSKLNQDAQYKKLFLAAFGDDHISGDRIFKALSQFMLSMISAQSKYDQVKKGLASFTNEEQKGQNIFNQKCASCHSGELFTDQSFRNTGMYYNSQYEDAGRYRVTLDQQDWMKFRVPSLRNIEFTAPYMHDGRFYSLEAVLNFYTDNVENQANLDPILKQNGRLGIAINSQEKLYLIAFLKTLSDQSFISNPKFSE